MKTTNFALYAVPVALLIMAGGLAAPVASAEPGRERTTVSGVFAYDHTAPVETIYADLQRTARRLCVQPTARVSAITRYVRECVASVVEDGINRIGRKDLAQIHDRARG